MSRRRLAARTHHPRQRRDGRPHHLAGGLLVADRQPVERQPVHDREREPADHRQRHDVLDLHDVGEGLEQRFVLAQVVVVLLLGHPLEALLAQGVLGELVGEQVLLGVSHDVVEVGHQPRGRDLLEVEVGPGEDGGVDVGLGLARDGLDHAYQQLVLGLEGVVEAPQRHLRLTGDRAGGGPCDAVASHHRDRCLGQQPTSLLRGHPDHGRSPLWTRLLRSPLTSPDADIRRRRDPHHDMSGRPRSPNPPTPVSPRRRARRAHRPWRGGTTPGHRPAASAPPAR